MAMIEHFYKAHVLTIMTTHYSELKTFAYEHEGMQNASVEFDPERCARPTVFSWGSREAATPFISAAV